MGDTEEKMEPQNEDGRGKYVLLTKDRKQICRTLCIDPPSKMPAVWNVSLIPAGVGDHLSGLPSCFLRPAPENSFQNREWYLFLRFLQKYKKVATAETNYYKFYILPPEEGSKLSHAIVVCMIESLACIDDSKDNGGGNAKTTSDASHPKAMIARVRSPSAKVFGQSIWTSPLQKVAGQDIIEDGLPPDDKVLVDAGSHEAQDLRARTNRTLGKDIGLCSSMKRNYVQTHPSYLNTLGQAHSGWLFGAIAELVDNSRDAKATKLNLSIDMIYLKSVGKEIPMLSVVDNGHGMTHQEILRMISFGHKQPEADDPDRIGRFGIGFKSGAMRLGKDALVLTQTANTRSIAFLSQSLNEGRDNLEIPVVSYRRIGQFMEVDTNFQDEAFSKYNLESIKGFSPFNEYLIGEKAGLFTGRSTGTQIYIWNLEEWGRNYSLEWETGIIGQSSYHHGDIKVRSGRVRTRPGQMSQKVQLDYSLRAYLEIIFYDPRMKIYIQGGLVKSRPLAKTLNKTLVVNGFVRGKPVQLTLGRCQLEWELANCGIFLYWHGRLIEAYKRVGSMIHNGDRGRGVIGVIDVTELMNDGYGRVRVHNNKQGFQDCEEYAELEKWLGKITDGYIDKYVDKIPLKRKSALYKPDRDWVQCDKCRKWRMLRSEFRVETLPDEWFCYMEPFKGMCDMPEEKVENGVITVSEMRTGYSCQHDPHRHEEIFHGEVTLNSEKFSQKRCRRRLRGCRKRRKQ